MPYLVRRGPTFIAVFGDKINADPSIIGRKPVNFIIPDNPIEGPSSFSSIFIASIILFKLSQEIYSEALIRTDYLIHEIIYLKVSEKSERREGD